MAMLFSQKVKMQNKEANVNLLLEQAETRSHPDKLLIENGRQLVNAIPDCVLAPKTESSEVCDRRVQETLQLLDAKQDENRAPFKP